MITNTILSQEQDEKPDRILSNNSN